MGSTWQLWKTNHAMRIFADFDPPQTFALRADETLGNERQTVEIWASAAGEASACNSISHADHAASGRATPTRTCPGPPSRAIERDPRAHPVDEDLCPS